MPIIVSFLSKPSAPSALHAVRLVQVGHWHEQPGACFHPKLVCCPASSLLCVPHAKTAQQ